MSISFSSTDYVGHVFGPSSLESEDNVLRLDRLIEDLLAFVDKSVGMEHTLVVLSADHGSPEAPGYLNSLGVEAGYVDPDAWDRAPAIQALKKQFGLAEDLIQGYEHPYIYLNYPIIQDKKLNPEEVERALVREFSRFEGVALAVSSRALASGGLPDTDLYRKVLYNFNPLRSGDIYIVFKPHWFINDFDGLTVTATHGSPWIYDSFVPVVFAGSGVPARHIHRRVHTVDIAITLSRVVGAKPPSGAAGVLLEEIFH